MAGLPDLNISSPKQLGELLFERLRIASDVKMTRTKQYSTSEEELLKYRDKHPIVDKILEYRSLKKLLSTYIEALPQLVNPQSKKIHTSFNQAVASTGRLSSNNPNLQNIPIREERGREIRKAFVPSSEQHVILSADYSQIELRLMAHVSEDPAMLEAFQQGADIHAATASKIFKVPLGEVTREQRSRAKTANFGMIYGISSFGLSQRLGISRTEAKELMDGYFSTYQGVKRYMDSCVKSARERGWVSTIFGRKRYLPDINSNNATVRGLAERNAINAPIQGSAADIIKMAMIRIHREFKSQGLQSRMIIQVHDELVFDVFKPELDTVKNIVKNAMESAAKLSVPLVTDMGLGANWLEAH
jgi:DNA polymerase-1